MVDFLMKKSSNEEASYTFS